MVTTVTGKINLSPLAIIRPCAPRLNSATGRVNKIARDGEVNLCVADPGDGHAHHIALRCPTTGPPELPGCMPPLTSIFSSSPEVSFVRRAGNGGGTDGDLLAKFVAEREAQNVNLLRFDRVFTELTVKGFGQVGGLVQVRTRAACPNRDPTPSRILPLKVRKPFSPPFTRASIFFGALLSRPSCQRRGHWSARYLARSEKAGPCSRRDTRPR